MKKFTGLEKKGFIKKTNPIAVSQEVDLESVDEWLEDFKEAYRNLKKKKAVICSLGLFLTSVFIALYAFNGFKYEKTNTILFYNYENNPTYGILDAISMGDDGSSRRQGGDNKQEYANQAVTSLGSEDFFKFLLNEVKKDKSIKTFFEQEKNLQVSENEAENLNQLKKIFNQQTTLKASESGGVLKNKPTGFFTITTQAVSERELETLASFFQKNIIEFLRKKDREKIFESKEIVEKQIEAVKKQLEKQKQEQELLFAASPKLTDGYVNQLGIQLEQAKANLAGNEEVVKNLSNFFHEIEKKAKDLNSGLTQDDSSEDLNFDLERNLAHFKSILKNLNQENQVASNTTNPENMMQYFQNNKTKQSEIDQNLVDTLFIAQQNKFSEAKVQSLEKIFDKIKSEFNQKLVILKQIDALEKEMEPKRRMLLSLENSILKLDIMTSKNTSRIEGLEGSSALKSILPLNIFIVFISCFSFLISAAAIVSFDQIFPSTLNMIKKSGCLMGTLPNLNINIEPQQNIYPLNRNMSQEKSLVKLFSNLKQFCEAEQNKIILFTGTRTTNESSQSVYQLAMTSARLKNKTLLIETNSSMNLSTLPQHSGLPNLVVAQCSQEELSSTFFEKSKNNYDLIFLHASPCMLNSEAATLSLFCGLSLLCLDSLSLNKIEFQNISQELELLNSSERFYVLNNFQEEESKTSSETIPSITKNEDEMRKAS